MLKKQQSSITLTLLFTILILYLLNSNLIIKEFLDYTNLFITKLFPTTFIIYIFSNIFIEYKIIDKLNVLFKNKAAPLYIIIMSILSGFPSGPKYIKDLLNKNYITKETANYLIYFTHFPNPLFILGTVSMIINNYKTTIIILISLILSNLLLAILLPKPQNNIIITTSTVNQDFSQIISDSITKSLKVSLLVYGTSIFFYLISVIINNYFNLPLSNYIIINSIFDLTKGITLSSLIQNKTYQALFIIILISIGSLSIHIQIKSILSDTNIKYINFIKGRIISTTLAIIIFLILRSL